MAEETKVETPETQVETPVVETPVEPVVETKVEVPSIEDAIGAALDEASGVAPKKVETKVEEQPEEEFDADKHQQGPKGELLRDPTTGRFLPRDGKKPEEKEAEGKQPENKEGEQTKTGKDDDLDGAPEKEWSKRTQERFGRLSSRVRDAEERAGHSDQLFQRIASTGVSPEQFGQTMTFLRLFHSKNPTDNQQAYEFLKREVEGMALKLGIDDPMVDVLRGHEDLKAKVAAGQMQAKDARELAMQRNRAANEAHNTQQRQQQEQQQQAHTAARTAAVSALDALGAQLKASDPNYQAKYDALVGPLKEVFKTIPPSQWVDTFKRAYAAAKVAAPAPVVPKTVVPTVKTPVVVKQQPMRAKTPSGEGKQQPKSVDEAISAALTEYAGR